MFTGIVEETGKVIALERSAGGARLTARASLVTTDIRAGDSIAVNGCCLTVTAAGQPGGSLAFDLLDETLQRTNLHAVVPGSLVNLERALAANARLGGHFVSGHIDCTTPVIAFEKSGADYRLEVALPKEFARYAVYKGSIAVNGVTNLRSLQPGLLVNLEFDMLAKYVERILVK